MSRHVLFDHDRPKRVTSSTALRMSRLPQRKYSQIKKSTKSAPALSKKPQKLGRETKKLNKKMVKKQSSYSTFSLQSCGCYERQPEKPKKIQNFKRFSSITTSRISQLPQKNSQIRKPTKSAPILSKKSKKSCKDTKKSEIKIKKRPKVESSMSTLSFQSSSCFERQQETPRRLKNFRRMFVGGFQNKFSSITASRLYQVPQWRCPQTQQEIPRRLNNFRNIVGGLQNKFSSITASRLSQAPQRRCPQIPKTPKIHKPSKNVVHRYPARKPVVRKFSVRHSREDAMNIFASKMQNLEVENNLLKNRLKSVTEKMDQFTQSIESRGSSHVADTSWGWVNNDRIARILPKAKTIPGAISTTLMDVTKYLPRQRVPQRHLEIQNMNIKNKFYDANVRDWHDTNYSNHLKRELQYLREENKMLRSVTSINQKEDLIETMMSTRVNEKLNNIQYQRDDDARQKLIETLRDANQKEDLIETMMSTTVNEKNNNIQYQKDDDAMQKLVEALRDAKNQLEKRLHDMEQLQNEQNAKNTSLENQFRRVQATNESLRISLEASRDDCRRVEKEFESYKLKMNIMMSAKDIEIQSIKDKTTSEEDTLLLIDEINALKKKVVDSERLAKDLHEDRMTMQTMIQNLEARSAKADRVFSVLREALKFERSAKIKFESQCGTLREEIKSLEKGGKRKPKKGSVRRQDSELLSKKPELNK